MLKAQKAQAPVRTREQLMRAAEKLFARDGIDRVSVRAIIREAGQKNESALQYHFGNREGLIEALRQERAAQVNSLRLEMLGEAPADLTLREMCLLLVKPPFLLCREDPGFRDYVGVFGQLVLASSRSIVATLTQAEAADARPLARMIETRLDLPPGLFPIRLENATRYAALSVSKRARDGASFRGREAELFLNDLADTLAAILSAPVSAETQVLLNPTEN